MLFQNSCVEPCGMTAMVNDFPAGAVSCLGWQARTAMESAAARASPSPGLRPPSPRFAGRGALEFLPRVSFSPLAGPETLEFVPRVSFSPLAGSETLEFVPRVSFSPLAGPETLEFLPRVSFSPLVGPETLDFVPRGPFSPLAGPETLDIEWRSPHREPFSPLAGRRCPLSGAKGADEGSPITDIMAAYRTAAARVGPARLRQK